MVSVPSVLRAREVAREIFEVKRVPPRLLPTGKRATESAIYTMRLNTRPAGAELGDVSEVEEDNSGPGTSVRNDK